MKGRPPRVRGYLEELDRVALWDLRPLFAHPGATAMVHWPSGARLLATVEGDALDLEYHPAPTAGFTAPVRGRATLERYPQPFGGTRTYARCPACGARVRVLYIAARLRCRGCCGHTYRACSSAPEHRLLRKHRRLREKITPDARHLPPGSVPPRPRWMFRRVYARLAQEAMAPWQARNDILLPKLGAAVAALRASLGLPEVDAGAGAPSLGEDARADRAGASVTGSGP